MFMCVLYIFTETEHMCHHTPYLLIVDRISDSSHFLFTEEHSDQISLPSHQKLSNNFKGSSVESLCGDVSNLERSVDLLNLQSLVFADVVPEPMVGYVDVAGPRSDALLLSILQASAIVFPNGRLDRANITGILKSLVTFFLFPLSIFFRLDLAST